MDAAKQETKAHQKFLTSDRDSRLSTISESESIAKTRLASAETRVEDLRASGSPAARQAASTDQSLVLMAKQAVLGNGQFTVKDAQRARDIQVREDLGLVAGFAKVQKEVRATMPELNNEIKTVDLNLAQLTRDSAAIESLPKDSRGKEKENTVALTNKSEKVGNTERPERTEVAIDSSELSGRDNVRGAKEQFSTKPLDATARASERLFVSGPALGISGGTGPSDRASTAQADSSAGPPSRTSLRDRLRAKLKEHDAIQKASGDSTDEALRSFDRDLDADSAHDDAATRHLASSSSGEALRAMMINANAPPPLAAEEFPRLGIVAGDVSDTAALMKAQLDEQASGIAGADSEPIFSRVHRYYVAWAKRR